MAIPFLFLLLVLIAVIIICPHCCCIQWFHSLSASVPYPPLNPKASCGLMKSFSASGSYASSPMKNDSHKSWRGCNLSHKGGCAYGRHCDRWCVPSRGKWWRVQVGWIQRRQTRWWSTVECLDAVPHQSLPPLQSPADNKYDALHTLQTWKSYRDRDT